MCEDVGMYNNKGVNKEITELAFRVLISFKVLLFRVLDEFITCRLYTSQWAQS